MRYAPLSLYPDINFDVDDEEYKPGVVDVPIVHWYPPTRGTRFNVDFNLEGTFGISGGTGSLGAGPLVEEPVRRRAIISALRVGSRDTIVKSLNADGRIPNAKVKTGRKLREELAADIAAQTNL